jgi:hypothetical protein
VVGDDQPAPRDLGTTRLQARVSAVWPVHPQ